MCSFSHDGKLLFASSPESFISVCAIENDDGEFRVTRDFKISTHDLAIKSFAVSPSGQYLAYLDASSNFQIVSMTVGPRAESLLSNIDHSAGQLACARLVTSNTGCCKLSWHPSDQELVAVPGRDGTVYLFKRTNEDTKWSESILIADGDISEAVFSPSGNYIAACNTEGAIYVWSLDVTTKSYVFEKKFCCKEAGDTMPDTLDLCWGIESAGKLSLLVASSSNYVILSKDQLVRPKTHLAEEEEVMVQESQPAQLVGEVENRMKRLKKTSNDTDSNADDDLFDGSIENVKKEFLMSSNGMNPANMLDDEEDEVQDEDEEAARVQRFTSDMMLRSQAVAQNRIHPVLQLASTRPDEKQRRYLVWNNVGNITSREESASNRVEIRFANTGGRFKNEVFPDHFGFTMASLSTEGAVFASDPVPGPGNERDGEEVIGAGSTVYYHAFAGSSRLDGCNENFTITLPNGEGAQSVAVGTGWIAVATNRGWLRLFSSTGLQLLVTWLSGPVVALVGSDEHLAIIVNESTVGSEYRLGAQVLHIPSQTSQSKISEFCRVSLPLSEGASLSWAGFSVDGHNLSIIDSKGVVSLLFHVRKAWLWVPVLEIERVKRSPDHKYWPIMISRGGKLAYVLLNGENKPAVFPLPVVSTRQFSLPVIESQQKVTKEGKDGKAEVTEGPSKFIVDALLSGHIESDLSSDDFDVNTRDVLEKRLSEQEVDADRTILKLLQDACKLQNTHQALDLAFRLRTDVALNAAIKIANHFGKSVLAQKLEDIVQQREADRLQAQGYQNADADPYDDPNGDAENYYHSGNDNEEYESPEYEAPGPLPETKAKSLLGKRTVVTPQHQFSALPEEVSNAPVNPFKKTAFASPGKRRDALNALNDLKASPSPKKPLLNVSFHIFVYFVKCSFS